MPIRVLIADDSSFICKKIQQILLEDSRFEIAGIARNGQEAVLLAKSLQPDVITMDIEMPVMDGITAVKTIMQKCPVPILMFSAFTQKGAKSTLEALDAGAIDFLPKNLDEINSDRTIAKRMLRHKVSMVAMHVQKLDAQSSTSIPVVAKKLPTPETKPKHPIRILVLVASTGGPVAIQKVISNLSASCTVPILIVQHMPRSFTRSFAVRLDHLLEIHVQEAEHGASLARGVAYLAPGGQQMLLQEKNGKKYIQLREKTAEEIYSPCADITLKSVAQVYKSNALVVVLTGMGADGKAGAELIKNAGSTVWAQDEASCTIYGMPKAVVEAELADRIYNLDELAAAFGKMF